MFSYKNKMQHVYINYILTTLITFSPQILHVGKFIFTKKIIDKKKIIIKYIKIYIYIQAL